MPKGYYRSNAARDNQHNAEGAVGLGEVHAGPDNVYPTRTGENPEPGGWTDVDFAGTAPVVYPFPKDTYQSGSLRKRTDAHRHT